MGQAVRAHWGIENSLHWVLDVAFDEDQNRARKGHSAANLAVIRHIALNLIKQDKTSKVGVKTKRARRMGSALFAQNPRYSLSPIALVQYTANFRADSEKKRAMNS